MDEFDLIRRYFAPLTTAPGANGLKDDVAEIAARGRLIATADAIVEGVHFLPDDPLDTVAAKLVRSNVSDIIAKGGEPDGALLTLIWPKKKRMAGLEAFAKRFGAELKLWGAQLLGGDTTATDGPLTLSLTLLGRCGERGPVRRSGAKAGDDLWVTGVIGDGWLGLEAARGNLKKLSKKDREALATKYRVPEPPPVSFAAVIARSADASIDVSDGLVADARHIAEASGVELLIDWMDVPLSEAARHWLAAYRDADPVSLFTGGDDYQTLFAAPQSARESVRKACDVAGVAVSRIGRAETGEGVRLVDASGRDLRAPRAGWRHFVAERRTRPVKRKRGS